MCSLSPDFADKLWEEAQGMRLGIVVEVHFFNCWIRGCFTKVFRVLQWIQKILHDPKYPKPWE